MRNTNMNDNDLIRHKSQSVSRRGVSTARLDAERIFVQTDTLDRVNQ